MKCGAWKAKKSRRASVIRKMRATHLLGFIFGIIEIVFIKSVGLDFYRLVLKREYGKSF